jgi:Na+/proline symporter
MLAGMKSLSSCDIFNGSLIIIGLLIAFPYLLIKAGGFSGMSHSFELMGDKPDAMKIIGTFKAQDYINWLLPTFLLVVGDANQYQRLFSSKNIRGAKQAAYMLVVAAIAVELLIIASAWVAGSMTPDPANGKYILIYAARHYMHWTLGLVFMTTVVAIIVSTADSFLLVPATTFMHDVYTKYINKNANEKRIVLLSRLLVVMFGVAAYLVTKMFAETTGFFAKAMYAYTIYGAGITPCLVAAMFWKNVTKEGAVTSILAGTITTLLWGEFIKNRMPDSLKQLDAVLPAIAVSVTALVVVSLLTKKRKMN